MTAARNDNAPDEARNVVKQFSPVGTGSANHTTCAGCRIPMRGKGHRARGKDYCPTCWYGAMAIQHNAAALA